MFDNGDIRQSTSFAYDVVGDEDGDCLGNASHVEANEGGNLTVDEVIIADSAFSDDNHSVVCLPVMSPTTFTNLSRIVMVI